MRKLFALTVVASAMLAALAVHVRGDGWGFGVRFGDGEDGNPTRFDTPWDRSGRDCGRDEGDGRRTPPWVLVPTVHGPFHGGDAPRVPRDAWNDGVVVEDPHRFPISDPPPHSCHCQGGRLLIVIGDRDDRTIRAAQNWAMYHFRRDLTLVPPASRGAAPTISLHPHLHILRYGTNDRGPIMTRPRVGEARVARVTDRYGETRAQLAAEWSEERELSREDQRRLLPADCCHLDEVMIMFHGHQDGVYEGLIEYLPYVLNGRPARRAVIWSCQSGERFFPKQADADPPGVYERLLGILRPRNCPCGCDPAHCRAIDADGRPSTCPSERESVTVLTAGFYVHPNDRDRARVPVNLEINLEEYENGEPRTLDGVLSSPDGSLRQITVHPDGGVAATTTSVRADGLGVQVFGPIRAGANGHLPPRPRGARPSAPDLLRTSQVDVAPDPSRNDGLRVCPVGDGCIPDAAASDAR